MSEEFSAEAPQEEAPAATEQVQEVVEEVTETTETAEPNEQVTEKVESQSNVQARIDKLTAKRYTAERERDDMRQQLDKIEQERANEILNRPAPTEAQFDYDTEAHTKAVQDHYFAQGQAQGQAQALKDTQVREAQASHAREVATYNARVQEFTTKAPDFVQSVGTLQVPADIQQVLMRDEQGPEMAYLASKNPEIAVKLMSLDPSVRTQGIVDIKMKIASNPKANNISSAGEPNTSQVQTGIKPEQDEFMKKFPNAEIMQG